MPPFTLQELELELAKAEAVAKERQKWVELCESQLANARQWLAAANYDVNAAKITMRNCCGTTV